MLAHIGREEAGAKGRRWLWIALEREERRPHEQQAPDKRRDRVPRQPEDERAASDAEGERLARTHRDTPEDLLDSESCLDPANQIMRPDRDTARRHDDIGAKRVLERLDVRRLAVLRRTGPLDDGARLLEGCRDHDPVRLVDLDPAAASHPRAGARFL